MVTTFDNRLITIPAFTRRGQNERFSRPTQTLCTLFYKNSITVYRHRQNLHHLEIRNANADRSREQFAVKNELAIKFYFRQTKI